MNVFPFVILLLSVSFAYGIFRLFPTQTFILTHPIAFVLCIAGILSLLKFIASYLNTAVMQIVLRRLNHEEATLTFGFHAANKQIINIITWTVFKIFIGTPLKFLEGIDKLLNKLFTFKLSYPWHAATFFVLPIMISERVGPFTAMQRSLLAIGLNYRNTVSVKAFSVIVFIFIFFILNEFIFSYPIQTTNIFITMLPIFLIIYLFSSLLETILISALYLNLRQFRTPKHFDPTTLARVFEQE